MALRSVQSEMIKGGLCRTTINARINRIRRVFRWGVGAELVPPSVYEALRCIEPLRRGRTAAPEPEGVHPVSAADVEAALPFLPPPVAAMVRIQVLTGCRTGEVLSMRGCDLAPGEPNWEFRPANHKNVWRGKPRVIPLGPRAQAIVREFLREDPTQYLFSPAAVVRVMHDRRSGSRKSKRTPSEAGRRRKSPGEGHGACYSRRSYRQAIVRACRRAGIAEWTPLQLRHAAATAIRARFGLESAQVVLGHARADVTQIYAERDLARAHSIMAEVG